MKVLDLEAALPGMSCGFGLGALGALGFWGLWGLWGFGALGLWGFGVLGFWGFGVLGFWGLGVLKVVGCMGMGLPSGFGGFGVFSAYVACRLCGPSRVQGLREKMLKVRGFEALHPNPTHNA